MDKYSNTQRPLPGKMAHITPCSRVIEIDPGNPEIPQTGHTADQRALSTKENNTVYDCVHLSFGDSGLKESQLCLPPAK